MLVIRRNALVVEAGEDLEPVGLWVGLLESAFSFGLVRC